MTYTRLDLLQAIDRAQYQKGDTPLRTRDEGKYNLPSITAIRRVFGTWNQALTEAGITPDPRGGTRT